MKINKTNIAFFSFVHFIGLIGIIMICLNKGNTNTLIFAFFLLNAGGLSITIGYHRLFTHKSFECHSIVKLFLLIFASTTFQDSAMVWCRDHRLHHRYNDTKKDPYGINRGFWGAHFKWILVTEKKPPFISILADLTEDKLILFQHRYYLPLAVFFTFITPILACALWNDLVGGFFIACGLRLVILYHCTWLINSACHTYGKRKYQATSARDNWLLALLTWGEGYHNYHHAHPIDYRNGWRWYHYDPSKWLIKGMSFLKLTQNLKTVDAERQKKAH